MYSTMTEERRTEMAATLTRYREDLESGRTFALHYQSHRSRRTGCVLNRTAWAQLVEHMAQMARLGDAYAQIASAVVGKAPLYGDRRDLCANAYDAVCIAWRRGYDDVVGRSGPEGGRYGVKLFGSRVAVVVSVWLEFALAGSTDSTTGIGWAAREVMDELNIQQHMLPKAARDYLAEV